MGTGITEGTAERPRGADAAERRRIDRAGARLLREPAADRVHWTAVSELARLVDADLVSLMTTEAACHHPDGCARPECASRLRVRATLGNADPGFAGAVFDGGAPWLGGVLASRRPVVVVPATGAPEGLTAVAAMAVDDPPAAAVVMGRRRTRPWEQRDLARMERLGVFTEAALAAAGARSRAEREAVLRERRRVAKELHDTVGQLLFGAGVATRMARESVTTGRADAVERIVGAEQEIGRATAALRHAMRALDAPRATHGALPAGVGEVVETFRRRTGTPVQLIVMGVPRALGLEEERLLVRAAAEGLSNAERHGRAGEVVVTLSYERERVAVVVQDDGRGVGDGPGSGTGLGLDLLREECRMHGGDLTLATGEDDGATMRAWVAAGR